VTAGSLNELALNVTLHDEFDNVCTLDSSSAVQLSIASGFNVGGATLSGTTTVTAVAGVASFRRGTLSLDKVGVSYRLQVSAASGTITLNTDAFTVQGCVPCLLPLRIHISLGLFTAASFFMGWRVDGMLTAFRLCMCVCAFVCACISMI
jgi:hypothetical protein